ncbi:MAG: hypothetical protein PHV95_01395 [Eubacteriales bacterium]|nr:hypothetical protein [Eubacteriales bacterium]
MNQKYAQLQKKYADSFQELNASIASKAYKWKYSKGGATLHRGFYSPSSLDLVIGGCDRGRLLKSKPKSNTYDYEYIFDDKGNIICSKKYSDEFDGVFSVIAVELFVYKKNIVLSFEFEPYHNHALTFISECKYENGRLARYESAICGLNYDGKSCTEINIETFEYADDWLKSVYWYRYTPSIQLLDQNKFIFTRDEEGYLSTYTVERLGGCAQKNDFYQNSESFKVIVKRK